MSVFSRPVRALHVFTVCRDLIGQFVIDMSVYVRTCARYSIYTMIGTLLTRPEVLLQ